MEDVGDGINGAGRLRSQALKAAASVLASSFSVSEGEIRRIGCGAVRAARIEVVGSGSVGAVSGRGG